MENIKLTQYSHGAGCGCKIAPKVLDQILKTDQAPSFFPNLLVGNEGRDDAAVFDLGNGTALVSTTDFFTPIVDDPFDFGRVAAANAISDVYAMGGSPLMAIAILGWPVEKLPASIAQQVLDGGRETCRQANIPLAGGHSIDSPEPFFGLAVTGVVPVANLKKNGTAQAGDLLFLTKPLGSGILSTAQKRVGLSETQQSALIEVLAKLNTVGQLLGQLPGVTAMTDVTGFGLLGHLVEMAEGSGLSAEISYSKLPVIQGVKDFLAQRIIPDATTRNWSSYGEKIGFGAGVNVLEAFSLLPDPQTNGGILCSVREEAVAEVVQLLMDNGLGDFAQPIGKMVPQGQKLVQVLG